MLKDTYECKRQEWLLHQQGKSDKNKPVFAIKLEDAKQDANSKLDASGIVGFSYKSAQHALVDNFQEYEILKEKERASYQQASLKVGVTASSIMRHVRWKLGKISDKQFFDEEYAENHKLTQRQENEV